MLFNNFIELWESVLETYTSKGKKVSYHVDDHGQVFKNGEGAAVACFSSKEEALRILGDAGFDVRGNVASTN